MYSLGHYQYSSPAILLKSLVFGLSLWLLSFLFNPERVSGSFVEK
jgi:hypothetical protein